MNFTETYNGYKDYFERELYDKLSSINCPNQTLKDAMIYSVKNGGKRIRPVLMLATAEMLGIDRKDVLNFCMAIECIHTYSLIHDDLPAMDNDDLRRGKPTNHKVYGEAMAILAGDALLNYAFELILRRVNDNNSISASRLLALYAGAFGMIGGQALDVSSENLPFDQKSEDLLNKIHDNKTGRLLSASVLVPSCLAGNLYFDELSAYGKNLGLLFQITDDILDYTSSPEVLGKSVNKDENSKKLTFVTMYGLETARKKAEESFIQGVKAVEGIEGANFLVDFIKFVKDREF